MAVSVRSGRTLACIVGVLAGVLLFAVVAWSVRNLLLGFEGPELSRSPNVSIRVSKGPLLQDVSAQREVNGEVQLEGVGFEALISRAYNIPDGGVRYDCEKPTRRFNVSVTGEDKEQRRGALRAELERALGFTAEVEKQERAVLVLKCSAGKCNLPVSSSPQYQMKSGESFLSIEAGSLDDICKTLTGLFGSLVVDETGLDGRYDWDTEWGSMGELRKQLQSFGFELVDGTREMEVLIIRRP
ncbi:MAG: DUF3738 domain-containing protein [Planctomycetaceae bacterium]